MQKINIELISELNNKTLEEIKRLRTIICYKEIKVINITSTVSKEGKSFISFWLAHSLSALGKKVVLIDGNLRSGYKCNIFTLDKKINSSENKKEKINFDEIYLEYNGLSDFLIQRVRKEEITYNTSISNLDIILSGKIPLNPSEILSSFMLKDLIKYLRENYDYVIFDTPALGEVTDALIIAPYCDKSILVVETGATSYKLAQNVIEQLNNCGSELLGVVINKA